MNPRTLYLWENSKGAKAERATAEALGLTIIALGDA